MSTQFDATAHSEARFDVLYMAARRQHTEALRKAEMARLAHSVERCRHEGASRAGRTAAAVRRVAHLITRKGRPTDESPGSTEPASACAAGPGAD